MRRRTLTGGVNAAVSVIALAGLLVALNYLANRHHLRRDLTANRFYSLSDQTRRVLAELDREVQVVAFYRSGDAEADRVKDLVKEYDDLSPQLTFEVVDPDRQPARARRYADLEYGITMVDAGERTERLDHLDEEALTNALIRVTRGESKKIGFLTGHGERNPEAEDERGYSALSIRLASEGFDTEVIHLADRTQVPEAIRALVIAGAEKELLPNERQAIIDYLERGGSVLVLADPAPSAAHAELLRAYGIELGTDIIVDVSGVGRLFGADEFLPMGLEYRSHPMTARFDLTTLYPHARSVRVLPAPPAGTEVSELVFTTEASWAEATPDRRPIELGPEDRQGPICVLAAARRPLAPTAAGEATAAKDSLAAAAASPDTAASAVSPPPPPEVRLVVAGDSDFCANGYSSFGGNLDLVLNAIEWLAEEEDLIAIRPRNQEDRRAHLTQTQATVVGAILLLAMPLSVIVAGVTVWWRRR
jgi:ABC-type uncharacterized transport system involved in gliding motility auxiliary subunit